MALVLTRPTVGLIVAAALAAGWMGATISQGPAPAQSARVGGGPRPIGSSANAAPRAERLRERTMEPPLPSGGRNPFIFGARRPSPAPSFRNRSVEAEAVPPMAAMPVAPPLPEFRLSGIASSTQDGAAVLTAIVIDNGTMVFAKAGDKLSRGYSVVRVEEMSVTLQDAAGVTQTIRMQ
jgi:hypothetical protein